jgi:FdhE protein
MTEWSRRIERAALLRGEQAAAEQVLGFYEQVLKIQSAIADDLEGGGARFRPEAPFRDQIDIEVALGHLPELIEMTNKNRRGGLYSTGDRSSAEATAHARNLMKAELEREIAPSDEPTAERFFSLALLQPAAEYLARQCPHVPHSGNRCPVCNALPQLAFLRQEGDGGKRSLQCSLCLTEWEYLRVLCPWCGETDKEKLPRYSADECKYVRVEACDTCKRYLKSVDLTVEGHAVPMVDEIALAALDVWAAEHGYLKIAQNLLGF